MTSKPMVILLLLFVFVGLVGCKKENSVVDEVKPAVEPESLMEKKEAESGSVTPEESGVEPAPESGEDEFDELDQMEQEDQGGELEEISSDLENFDW